MIEGYIKLGEYYMFTGIVEEIGIIRGIKRGVKSSKLLIKGK